MAWGKEWPSVGCIPADEKIEVPNNLWRIGPNSMEILTGKSIAESQALANAAEAKIINDAFQAIGDKILIGIDLSTGDSQTVLTTFEDGELKHRVITAEELYIKEHNNKVPTHDPYTNPNSQIYYECGCGAILDPGTKSFAQLNNHASNTGWKIRFTDQGYKPHCVKCGEWVE